MMANGFGACALGLGFGTYIGVRDKRRGSISI